MEQDTEMNARENFERDIEFSGADFERIRKLIYSCAGIALNDSKQQMAYSRLSRRVRATGAASFSEYLNRLEASRDSSEWQEFINSLTTNLTYFFREQHHFPVLEEFVKKHLRDHGRAPKVWCSAASTGEEPYSIAVTVAESGAPQARIIATDIDTNVLAHADRGVYKIETVQSVDSRLLRKYFLKGSGDNAGLVRIRPELRQMVIFRQTNLLEDSWAVRSNDPFDIIFCRNVMIYFDKPTQKRILQKFAQVLKPGGLLFAGHSENFAETGEPFRLRGKTVYERL
jgi:chemotaxis protein methyltransferase CheR